MSQEETGFLTNKQGQRLFWRHLSPDGHVRGMVMVVHGYAEHSGRHKNVIDKLLADGFEVFAPDLQGHGQSDGERGYVERFGDYVDDVHQLYLEQIAPRREDRRFFYFGHSMGAIIGTYYASSYPNELDGVVLSGPGTSLAGTPKALTAIASLLSRVTPKLGLKAPHPRDAISHDDAVVEAYHADPMVFAPHITVRLGAEMYAACSDGARRVVGLDLPLLIVYGAECVYMSGQQELFDSYRGADKTIHRYEGARHEVFNELPETKEKALEDLVTWLNAHL